MHFLKGLSFLYIGLVSTLLVQNVVIIGFERKAWTETSFFHFSQTFHSEALHFL